MPSTGKFFIYLQLYAILFCPAFMVIHAETYVGHPGNYRSLLPSLQPGDTLELTGGDYMDGLPLTDLVGTQEQPIVITGRIGALIPVIHGRECCNTISITRCAYVVIQHLVINGDDIPGIDAVKAEGTDGNWAHDITLDNLLIVGHGTDQQQVGISTKCPAWNWTIRQCIIEEAGTGMYLGNSNGEEPFVNGVIELNLVKNTIGYCLQIKHQNVGTRDLPEIVKNGKTIIRWNTFSKDENASSGGASRPNVLLGNFPATGDGSDDIYEVYGNFFYNNPSESLFQGTGTIALYNNVFLNRLAGYGVTIQQHNGFQPRDISVFHNTILVNSGAGIRFSGVDPGYRQRAEGNAVFASPAIQNAPDELNNITDSYVNAGMYVKSAGPDLATLDLEPMPGKLEGELILPDDYNMYTDYNRDFDGYIKLWTIRGAYQQRLVQRWQPNTTTQRSTPDGMLLPVGPPAPDPVAFALEVYPNPASGNVFAAVSGIGGQQGTLQLVDAAGRVLSSRTIDGRSTRVFTGFDLSKYPSGTYYIRLTAGMWVRVKPISVR